MSDPQREIQALVDTFVADLTELARTIALEQIKTAFEVGAANTKLPVLTSAPARKGRSEPAPKGRREAAVEAPTRGRKPRGASAASLSPDALRARLLSVIGDNPGRRTEEINAALGTTTALIAQPLKRLVGEQLVRTEGARRGTRYFLAGGVSSSSSSDADQPTS